MMLPALAFGAPVGTVTRVKGSVSLRTAAVAPYQSLVAGRQVEEGSWLKTGRDGWVQLTLADSSTITIANNTELEITRFLVGKEKREGILNLVEGKVRASVIKLSGRQTDIKVRSGTAVAGVKGTEFLMLAAGPANVFFGNEGSVEVYGGGSTAKLLSERTMTQTSRGYDPVEPVTVDPGTPLAEARDIFNAVTGPEPPEEWDAADNLPTIIARWDINYGHYLADRGDYRQALHVFQIALDLTRVPEIRADALLERGTVRGRFLGNPQGALDEFQRVLNEYPELPQAESALFNVGQTLYDLRRFGEAEERFRHYLQRYPAGRYRSTVETLLGLIRQEQR